MNKLCEDVTELEILNIIKRVEREKETQRMYHYTSMDTFFKIVENVKEDFFTFRAGSVYTMNDSQELKLGYEYLKKVIPLVDKQLRIQSEDSFLQYTTEIEKNSRVTENFGDWLVNDDKSCFVVSFSKASDLLPMWALYGDKGTGVCLEFSPYMIKKYYKANEYLKIEECVYNEEKIIDFLKRITTFYYKMYREKKDIKKNNPIEKAKYWATLCCTAGAYIKHYGFEYEKEIRLNVIRDRKEWHFYETHYHNRGAYVEVPIPTKALTGLIVGPATNMLDVRNSMIMCLRAKGICIEPEQSSIPFRLY